MVQIEVRYLTRHVGWIGKTRVRIARGIARNRAGLAHHVAHRVARQGSAAGRTLGAIEINRDAQAAVALVLDGLDLAEPHRDTKTLSQADVGFGLGRARGARLRQREGHDIGEFRNAGCVDGL